MFEGWGFSESLESLVNRGELGSRVDGFFGLFLDICFSSCSGLKVGWGVFVFSFILDFVFCFVCGGFGIVGVRGRG